MDYADLPNLKPSSEQYKRIKEAGCVVIRNVIAEEQAQKWFDGLQENADSNPNYDGNHCRRPNETVKPKADECVKTR